jgi:peroxiredoxin
MKNILAVSSFLLSLISVFLTFTEFLEQASYPALLAVILAMKGVKEYTFPAHIYSYVFASLALGFSLDPVDLYFLPMGAIIGITGAVRPLFFRQLGNTGFPLLEVFTAILALGAYLTANIIHPSGWQAWAIPAPSVLFSLYLIMGPLMTTKEIKERKLHGFGVDVGSEAPDFTLPDENGKEVTLSSFEGVRTVLLMFVRGDWCPSCHIMLRTYEKNRKKFQEKNILMLAVGPDPVDVNKNMVKRLEVDYHILSDEEHKAVKQFGIKLQNNIKGTAEFQEGIPLPAAFLICEKGIIRYLTRSDRPGEILNPEDIFTVMDKIA